MRAKILARWPHLLLPLSLISFAFIQNGAYVVRCSAVNAFNAFSSRHLKRHSSRSSRSSLSSTASSSSGSSQRPYVLPRLLSERTCLTHLSSSLPSFVLPLQKTATGIFLPSSSTTEPAARGDGHRRRARRARQGGQDRADGGEARRPRPPAWGGEGTRSRLGRRCVFVRCVLRVRRVADECSSSCRNTTSSKTRRSLLKSRNERAPSPRKGRTLASSPTTLLRWAVRWDLGGGDVESSSRSRVSLFPKVCHADASL